MRTDIKELEKILQYEFRKPELLERAVTHSSYANDKTGNTDNGNERLEFLGDSILDAVVSVFLYENMENREGGMTKARAAVVCEKSLAEVSRAFGLWEFLRLGKGEAVSDIYRKDAIIADGVEAIIGAVYLDGGADAASDTVMHLVGDKLKMAMDGKLFSDYKSELQEFVQKRGSETIEYKLVSESGPDHEKIFVTQVIVGGTPMGSGQGRTKKQAEQEAARVALAVLSER